MSTARWSTWGIRIGALGLAFLLWLYAVTENTYTREINARLRVHDLPGQQPGTGEVLVANPVPETVRIQVAGKGRDLLRLDSDSFVLHLRPEGTAGSVRNYRLTTGMVELRESLDVVLERVLEPREIEIVLDRRAERIVPVRSRIELETAEQYTKVGKPSIQPVQVVVSGPSAPLRDLVFVDTDSLVLRGLDEDVDLNVKLVLPADIPAELDPSEVRLKARIQLLAQDELRRVPVRVRNAPVHRYRAEPAYVRVRVKGGIGVIASLDPVVDVVLYVDAFHYQDGMVAIQYEEPSFFDIVNIFPAAVRLVEQ